MGVAIQPNPELDLQTKRVKRAVITLTAGIAKDEVRRILSAG
jgi:hypothetical protein